MIIEITSNKYADYKAPIDIKELVLDILKENKGTWIKSNEIAKELHIPENIRVIINNLRNDGNPIISSKEGYKYTEDKQEIKECYIKLRLRLLRGLTAARNLKKLL